MKRLIASIIIAGALCAAPGFARTVHVRGHLTKSGTYVLPHNRTVPDHTKLNNWSTRGNVNPYTGKSSKSQRITWKSSG